MKTQATLRAGAWLLVAYKKVKLKSWQDLFRVNNKDTKTMCENWSKVILKTIEEWVKIDQGSFFVLEKIKGVVMQIIYQEIYDRFNTNNKHWNFRIHSCSSF